MKCLAADLTFQYVVLFFFLTFSMIYGTLSRYSLFQGSPYAGTGHKHGNKNWCAYVVHKNVTCAVLGGTETFVEPEMAPCPGYQPDCPPQVIYRTQVRPVYKIGYKLVTELEWRCCPGHQGPDCKEVRGSPPRQIAWGPRPTQHSPGPVQHEQGPDLKEPGLPSQQQHDGDRGDRVSHLEDEVQRLSQTVLDMQAAMTGMNENLRLGIQEDASKMLVSFLNELRLPNAALGGATESIQLPGTGTDVEGGVEEVRAKLSDVTDALRTKNDAVRGTMETHDSQLRLLMEASRGFLATAAAPIPGPSPPSQDTIQTYIDEKIKDLREELMEGIEIKMADLKGSCEYKIIAVQEQCEERDANYFSLTELLESKEADLRKEIQELRLDLNELRTNGQAAATQWPTGVRDPHKNVERIAEAHHTLSARVHSEIELLSVPHLLNDLSARLEDLEARLNISEPNSEVLCGSIKEKLNQSVQGEILELRDLMIERFRSMEDEFTAVLMEMNNSSITGTFSERIDNLQSDVDSGKQVVQGLENKLNVMSSLCSTGCKSNAYNTSAQDVNIYRHDLGIVQSNVNGNSEKIGDLEDLVQRQLEISSQNSRNISTLQGIVDFLTIAVRTLGGAVSNLGNSLNDYSNDLQHVNSTCGKMGAQEAQELVDRRLSQAAINESRLDVLGFQLKQLASQVGVELSQCKETAEEVRKEVSGVDTRVAGVDSRVASVEVMCSKLDGVGNSLQRIKEGLNKHVTALWTCVHRFNNTLRFHSRDISGLRGSLQTFQAQLTGIAKGMQDLETRAPGGLTTVDVVEEMPSPASDIKTSTSRDPTVPLAPPLLPGGPQQPVLEMGVAGPPGTVHRVTGKLPQSDGSMTTIQGFAGAPGYPPLSPVSLRPDIIPGPNVPLKTAAQNTAAAAGGVLAVGPFSFSAGITQLTLPSETGVIRFNKVMVNDGEHYNPQTGIFTVPVDGRYLLSAVLAVEWGESGEAVLSVSDRTVQRLDTAGYGPGCVCRGPTPFSMILTLKRGDRVGLVMTAGKLVPSDSSEVTSTFSGIFLYATPTSR